MLFLEQSSLPMTSIAAYQSPGQPRLPVEVCENVIDMIAGPFDDYATMDPEARRILNICRLVCRAWVPRCRLHLFDLSIAFGCPL